MLIELESYLKSLNGNTLLSGGAIGSDFEWGKMARIRGDNIIHWSFEKHRTILPKKEIICLTEEQLEFASVAVKRANKTLKRRFPSDSHTTNSLLRRNWYQIAFTDSVYAIADFDSDGNVSGGTSWAIQMYLDRFLFDKEDIDKCKVFIFCPKINAWVSWHNKWRILTSPPEAPNGLWTGIGTRYINFAGKCQIRNLFGGLTLDLYDLEETLPIITDPKINDKIYVSDSIINGRGIENSLAGWGTVHSVYLQNEKQKITINELPDKIFNWNDLKPLQYDLRSTLKFKQAHFQPDEKKEHNFDIKSYRLKP